MSEPQASSEAALDQQPAIMLFFTAESFFKTAAHTEQAVVADTLKLRFEAPVYYLYSHALELLLKSYLRAKGMTASELRKTKIRHSLMALWNECRCRGLVPPPTTLSWVEEVIQLLELDAKTFGFRYPTTGMKRLPSSEDIRRTVEVLMQSIRPVVENLK